VLVANGNPWLGEMARLQQALLPSPELSVPGLDIGWNTRPCSELAGDLLNCLRLDEHYMAFFVLDVSGHGASSAVLSVQASRLLAPTMTQPKLLKERINKPPWYRIVEPRCVLLKLNERFQTTGEMPQYFTIVYGLLHVESGHLQIATSGHPGPILVPAKRRAEAITSRSHPVGFVKKPTIFEHELTLARGDRVWFYSDGVTEAEDVNRNEFGTKRLIELAEEQRSRPARAAVQAVMKSVERWSLPGDMKDDCSLLAIGRE